MTQKTSIQGWAPLIIIILVVIAIIAWRLSCSEAACRQEQGIQPGHSLAKSLSARSARLSRARYLMTGLLLHMQHARLLSLLQDGIVVTTVTADPESGYTVALKPGTYVVAIPKQGIGGSPDLPATVTIRSGETVRLDISIDTGIR